MQIYSFFWESQIIFIMAHIEYHLKNSAFITDVVIGMSDGLTVPFALAAGVSTAVSSNHIVITAGIAEIIAGAIAMGLGGYLAGRTEIEHYDSELKREYYEVDNLADRERDEVRDIFRGYGFSDDAQNMMVAELEKDKDKWVDFMMKFELGLEKPDGSRSRKSAFNIGISYMVGGIIPLLPYFFTATPLDGLKISAIVTLICLFTFGFLKSKATGQPLLSGAFKVMVIGAIAAAAAFFVARLFSA